MSLTKKSAPNPPAGRHPVLSTVVRKFSVPVLDAVSLLIRELNPDASLRFWLRAGARRVREPGYGHPDDVQERCAWMMVAIWLVQSISMGRASKIRDAEDWWLSRLLPPLSGCLSDEVVRQFDSILSRIEDYEQCANLLPYILESHGEGSRRSVMARPETQSARTAKKQSGVFYTPEDVAHYMVSSVLDGIEDAAPITVMDPACGTGVFLRAAARCLAKREKHHDVLDLVCSKLYGTDIDAKGLDAAAFVLFLECLPSVRQRDISPVAAWHAIRLNLVQVDALRLISSADMKGDVEDVREERLRLRAALKSGVLDPASSLESATEDRRVPFWSLFPEIHAGPRLIIGNPPYADVGRQGLLSYGLSFTTLKAAPREGSDVYPLFCEQMIRLAAPDAHGGAFVLPLSIACNSGRQFRALRQMVANEPGRWRFSFFDREPHALFGEDVKTRNAIVLWTRRAGEQKTCIETGSLMKWRTAERKRMFESIRHTHFEGDITAGIPKLGNALQVAAFNKLASLSPVMGQAVVHTSKSSLAEAMVATRPAVYIGPTAYNFLNVFVRPGAQAGLLGMQLSENPLFEIPCASDDAAFELYAILASRLCFWLWHATGDGFHVSKAFLDSLPLGRIQASLNTRGILASAGRATWASTASRPVVSCNKGRYSLAFNPSAAVKSALDPVVLDAVGLDESFAAELATFDAAVSAAYF